MFYSSEVDDRRETIRRNRVIHTEVVFQWAWQWSRWRIQVRCGEENIGSCIPIYTWTVLIESARSKNKRITAKLLSNVMICNQCNSVMIYCYIVSPVQTAHRFLRRHLVSIFFVVHHEFTPCQWIRIWWHVIVNRWNVMIILWTVIFVYIISVVVLFPGI